MIKMCLKRIKNKFYFLILPLVIGIATAGLIFQMTYFLPAIQTQSTRMILQTSCVGFYVMCFISYYQAINITNQIPETIIAPRKKNQLKNNHHFYTVKKICQKQNQRFKPVRTSHCHTCKCVSRMDHHCPYTNNCVGSKNLKAFILFCGYGGVFALQFFSMSVIFFFKLKNSELTYELSEGQIFIWMLLFIMSFLLSFSMNGLFVSNIMLVYKNMTQLDMLKGQLRFQDKHGTHPNPFDLGCFTNFNTVFFGDYWLFWWPTKIINDHDGTQFPMRPPVYYDDIKGLPEELQQKLKTPLQKSIPSTIQELREKDEERYKDYIFFYLGEQYKLKSKKEKQEEEIKKTLEEDEEFYPVQVQPTNKKTEEEMEMLEGIYDEQL